MRKLLIVLFVVLFTSSSARAQALLDIPEVSGTNRAVVKAREELDKSLDRLQIIVGSLLKYGNEAAKERLAQVDSIVASAMKEIRSLNADVEASLLRILERANANVAVLEKQLVHDLMQFVWKVECGGRRFVGNDMRDLLGRVGILLGLNTVRITGKVVSKGYPATRDFRYQEPFDTTFLAIRDYMEGGIKHANGEHPAYAIVATYEYLSELALKTSCFYPKSIPYWVDISNDYTMKALAWRSLLRIPPAAS